MKVVKDGRFDRPGRWSSEVTCPRKGHLDTKGCGATLLVTRRDLHLACEPGPCSRRYFAAVRCPQCGALVEVWKVPSLIWSGLLVDEDLLNPLTDSDFS
jgi:hypothetical protein